MPRAALIAAGVVFMAAAIFVAQYLPTPEDESGSPNAEDISTLYSWGIALGTIIFVIVEGVLIYSLVKFRARRGGPEPAQIRGNTTLEVSWTIGAALFLVILTTVTFIYLGDIESPQASKPESELSGLKFAALDQGSVPGEDDPFTVRVNGQQYLWRYDYHKPGETPLYNYHDLYVPVGRTVVLKIQSSDVVHSWWIPELGPKTDATPGHTNDTWFRVDKAGEYLGECAELCGDNHADMRARVIALPRDEFEAWRKRQAEDLKQSQAYLSLQRKVRGEN
ncbi:MAG TPA: cytochrome c oxidase subunit II [Thermoleophilaceae bacterium]|nr:cytochrome c oxidase subunit II [Thermoleophilaceae bacterium]